MIERVRAATKKPEAKIENKVSQIRKTGPSQSISSPGEQILFLQRTIGNQAVQRLIKSGALQAKLRIGQPGDIYEQEADRVAEQVMRMPEPQVSNETKVSNPARNNSIQRKCPGCNKGTKIGKEAEEEKLQKKETSGSAHEVTEGVENSISAVRGGGQPLPESVRAFYEPRYGADFSGVRVHTGAQAEETTKSINARAFTMGREITFGAGQFAPESHEGRRLMAHELTHVVQQSGVDGYSVNQSSEKRGLSPISRPNNTRLQLREAGSDSPARVTAAEYTGPGWTTVNKLGIVRVEEAGAKERGARLRREPSPSASVKVIHHLDENTRVFILAQNKDWRYVLVDNVDKVKNKTPLGSLGYVREYLIWTGLPDPDAVLYYIAKTGLGLQKVVENYYKDYDIRTGDDARSIVMAVLLANEEDSRTKGCVYLNQAKLAKALEPGVGEKIKDRLDEYRRVLRPILQSVELRLGKKIWLPGKSYIQALKGKGIIPTRPEWKNVAIAVVKGIGGFVAGLVEGFVGSIADVFIGIYELIKSVISFVVDLISGKAIEAAEELYDVVKEMSPIELFTMLKDALVQMISSSIEEFSRKWNADNTYNRWNYRGYVIGYILAEVLMIIFTAGTANIAKWLGKLGKIGEKFLKIFNKILGKVDDLLDKVPGRKGRKKDAGDGGEKGSDKARELPAALAMASAIAETHDAQDSPLAMVLLSLAPLKRRYKWIDKFDYDRKSPGHYEIVMYGSRHIVDRDYTTEVLEEFEEAGKKGIRTEPPEGTHSQKSKVNLAEDHHIATRYRKKNKEIFARAGLSIDDDLNLIKVFPEHGQLRGWYNWENRKYKFNMKGHHRKDYNDWVTRIYDQAIPPGLRPDEALSRIEKISRKLDTIIRKHPEVLSHGYKILPKELQHVTFD